MGVAIAFVLSLTYCSQLWDFVRQPAVAALKALKYQQQDLVQIEPMEAFNIIWFKLPVLCAIGGVLAPAAGWNVPRACRVQPFQGHVFSALSGLICGFTAINQLLTDVTSAFGRQQWR